MELTKEEKAEMLEDLKLEATSLGITYSAAIGYDKLKAKVDEFYDSESIANSVPVEVKKDVAEDKPAEVTSREEALAVIAKQKRAGKQTQVVKITMVDKREASSATSGYFNNGDIAMRVPLDEFVEMPQYLIDQAETARALTHVEINGVTTPKYTKKFVVEYKK